MKLITLKEKKLPNSLITLHVLAHDDGTAHKYQVNERHIDRTVPFRTSGNILSLDHALKKFNEWANPVPAPAPPEPPVLDLEHPPKGLRTQNGRAARVLGKRNGAEQYPYVVLIEDIRPDQPEYVYFANKKGWLTDNFGNPMELALTTGPVKKEGWTLVFSANGHETRIAYGSGVYRTREEAEQYKARSSEAISIAKITWEE